MPRKLPEGRDLEDAAKAQLRESGYDLVESDVAVPIGDRRRIFDIVAYSHDNDGELFPAVVVEVKANLHRQSATSHALAQLAVARETIGAQRYYVYDGQWYEPDRSFAELHQVQSPVLPALPLEQLGDEPSSARTNNVDLVARALEVWIQSRVGLERPVSPRDYLERLTKALEELLTLESQSSAEILNGVWIPAVILWRAARQLVEGAMNARASAGDIFLPKSIRAAMVNLARPMDLYQVDHMTNHSFNPSAGGSIGDPFCGPGLLLCDVLDTLLESGLQPEGRNAHLFVYGADPDPLLVRVATALLQLAPPIPGFSRMITVDQADRAADGNRFGVGAARLIVSAPPFGRKLSEPVSIRTGATKNADEAQLERCIISLKEGGRAVVLTTQRWLFSEESVGFRHQVSTDAHVEAIVGLPSGALAPSTRISTAITTFKNAPPATTLVGDLDEDWQEQVSPSGDFFLSYVDHLSSGLQR